MKTIKKIFAYSMFVLITCLWGCSDFLNETPNKSGSAFIYHMDQLVALSGNSASYRDGRVWTDFIFRGDGLDYSPGHVVRTGMDLEGAAYDVWSWGSRPAGRLPYLQEEGSNATTWTPAWNAIYTYNTVLENMDKVTQTTPIARKQVEGEALFGRAYFHFILLVQYALWDEDAPGIGYRFCTSFTVIPPRETVKYTLDNIYKDLADAEAALTEAGRTTFEPKRNFRPTVPTVKALRARIDLYRGNYASALENATAALAGHSVLLDFKNEPLYKVYDRADSIHFLDADNNPVKKVASKVLNDVLARGSQGMWEHPEFFLPHVSDLFYGNRETPISKFMFDSFDRENDERWKRFYENYYLIWVRYGRTVTLPGNTSATPRCFTWADQQMIEEHTYHAYLRFSSVAGSSGAHFILGMTTAEMHLIRAECLARAGNTADAEEALKTLRRARFTTTEAADNIGGSLQEVLDERVREMGALWRFFDIKRQNGAHNANITIRKTALTNNADINSKREVVIQPNDPRWAVHISAQQIMLMGWQQN
jgi:hypothetical protein